ncbi:MAG: hypothetical protein KDK36_15210, partial [Leptospiraceae bacterium]|nr:hypothetical protein [Leptospiraceae bacterium]
YKDNQNKDTSTSDTELQTAVNYTENLTKINNILTGLSGIMGSLDASGNFAYTSIDKINSLIAQYEKIKTEIANANGIQIPTSIETKIIELKSFAFETHKRNLALAYLSSQVGKEDIAGVNLLDEFIDSLKSGKYVMQGENGGPVQKDANFLGSPLNDAQLTEIKNYLKLYDAQSIVLRKENISDIETYISTADPEIQESIRKQAEFVSYQKINYSLAQGTYPDFNQISPSLLNYAVISSFQSFLNSKDEDDEFIYNEADIESRKDALNDFVLSSGITDSTLIGGISEFVDNFTSRNTSYYLPDFLKERNIQEKYYSMSYTAGITPGDMTAITNWLVDQKYESSLSNELNSIARMDYISKNYYGEENKNYLQEIDSSLTNFTGEGLTEEEKETFLLTNNGLSDSLRSHEYNPYYMIKSQNFTRNFNYENDYNSLKEEITNFQLALKKEMLTAEDNKRKEKFLNDALKGAININSYLVYSNTSQIGSKGYENDFTLNDRITARMKEVENLAEKKFGGFMNMLENFNSKAFIDAPMYSTNYSIRKTLSAIKNGLPGTNEMGESVDPFSYNVNDDVFSKNSTDGTYEFAGGLNNVKVAVDSFVTMTTNGSANVDRKLAEISRNQGIISSSSGSIITTGQTIEVLSQRLRSHNGDMVALLTEARNTFNYREGLFNTAQSEFNTQQNSVNTIQKAYDEKQLETSSAYQDMETAADNLKEITKLYEYQVLLESTLDSSLSPEDQAEDALGQDLKSKLIALAKKRRDDSISEYNKKAEEIKNLQSIVDKQVTLSDLNNNSQITTNRQETEDWALRAMRYSKAQKEIKAEIATLESEIRGLKNTLNGQIVPVLGNPPGGLRNSLEGYLDFAADDYILTENYYRDAYRLVNGIVDNKIGGWDFLSATS